MFGKVAQSGGQHPVDEPASGVLAVGTILTGVVLLVLFALALGVVYEVHHVLWWFTGLLTSLVQGFKVSVVLDWRSVMAICTSAPLTVYVWRTTGTPWRRS